MPSPLCQQELFEALDYVEWTGAHEILRPIVVVPFGEPHLRWLEDDLALGATACRNGQKASTSSSPPDEIWEDSISATKLADFQTSPFEAEVLVEFTQVMLGDDFERDPRPCRSSATLRAGVPPAQLMLARRRYELHMFRCARCASTSSERSCDSGTTTGQRFIPEEKRVHAL